MAAVWRADGPLRVGNRRLAARSSHSPRSLRLPDLAGAGSMEAGGPTSR